MLGETSHLHLPYCSRPVFSSDWNCFDKHTALWFCIWPSILVKSEMMFIYMGHMVIYSYLHKYIASHIPNPNPNTTQTCLILFKTLLFVAQFGWVCKQKSHCDFTTHQSFHSILRNSSRADLSRCPHSLRSAIVLQSVSTTLICVFFYSLLLEMNASWYFTES